MFQIWDFYREKSTVVYAENLTFCRKRERKKRRGKETIRAIEGVKYQSPNKPLPHALRSQIVSFEMKRRLGRSRGPRPRSRPATVLEGRIWPRQKVLLCCNEEKKVRIVYCTTCSRNLLPPLGSPPLPLLPKSVALSRLSSKGPLPCRC